MATENFNEQLRSAEDASCWARVTADALNHAAWGPNNTESSPPWLALHAHTVDRLCEHIDQLVTLVHQLTSGRDGEHPEGPREAGMPGAQP